jgi:hypothetical protein
MSAAGEDSIFSNPPLKLNPSSHLNVQVEIFILFLQGQPSEEDGGQQEAEKRIRGVRRSCSIRRAPYTQQQWCTRRAGKINSIFVSCNFDWGGVATSLCFAGRSYTHNYISLSFFQPPSHS